MPFRKRALLTITNESPREAPLFYDVDVTVGDAFPGSLAYFHARYRRENPTTPKKDFEVLPRIEGRGRYLGGNAAQLRALPEAMRPEPFRTHRRFGSPASPSPEDESAWENFESPQDVCATAYCYQTLPSPRWPALEPYEDRMKDLALPRPEKP